MARSKVTLHLIYHEIARRALMKQDYEEIAQATGLQPKDTQQLMRRPDFKLILEQVREKMYDGFDSQMRDEARNLKFEIMEAAEKSQDKLTFLLDNAASESLQVNIAQDFLDRAGHGAKARDEAPKIIIDTLEATIIMATIKKEDKARARLKAIPQLTIGPHPNAAANKDGSTESTEEPARESA